MCGGRKYGCNIAALLGNGIADSAQPSTLWNLFPSGNSVRTGRYLCKVQAGACFMPRRKDSGNSVRTGKYLGKVQAARTETSLVFKPWKTNHEFYYASH